MAILKEWFVECKKCKRKQKLDLNKIMMEKEYKLKCGCGAVTKFSVPNQAKLDDGLLKIMTDKDLKYYILYFIERKSLLEVAEVTGSKPTYIAKRLCSRGFRLRSNSQAMKIHWNKDRKELQKRKMKEYWDKRKAMEVMENDE